MTGPIPDLVQDFVSAGEATLHFVIACAVLLLTDPIGLGPVTIDQIEIGRRQRITLPYF
jgi:hypothetical protein